MSMPTIDTICWKSATRCIFLELPIRLDLVLTLVGNKIVTGLVWSLVSAIHHSSVSPAGG
jgi:hypothetical protein